ncbi:unnamed protein product, partial [Amoebophrya sp. A25]|eukprot:GSA25T00009637001.1
MTNYMATLLFPEGGGIHTHLSAEVLANFRSGIRGLLETLDRVQDSQNGLARLAFGRQVTTEEVYEILEFAFDKATRLSTDIATLLQEVLASVGLSTAFLRRQQLPDALLSPRSTSAWQTLAETQLSDEVRGVIALLVELECTRLTELRSSLDVFRIQFERWLAQGRLRPTPHWFMI